MTEQPEALYLADMLESDSCEEECFQAAALLRSLHAEIERLRAERDALRAIVQSVSTRVPHILAGGHQCACSWCSDIRAARAALKERGDE